MAEKKPKAKAVKKEAVKAVKKHRKPHKEKTAKPRNAEKIRKRIEKKLERHKKGLRKGRRRLKKLPRRKMVKAARRHPKFSRKVLVAEVAVTKRELKGKELAVEGGADPWKTLVYPHLTEKSMNMVEMENKLVFIVRRNSTKKDIKNAVEKEFGTKVDWVTTQITRSGEKKAYIKINAEYSAMDVASKLGMM